MFKFLSEKYQKIIHLNFLWAFLSFLFNFYLYPRLPEVVPNHFQWDGTPDNPGGRFIIGVLPLIFIVCNILFNEKILFRFFSRFNPSFIKVIAVIVQAVLWCSILYAYFYYFSLTQ